MYYNQSHIIFDRYYFDHKITNFRSIIKGCRHKEVIFIVLQIHYYMDNSIPQDKRQVLKNKINSSKKAIQSMLKQFKYQQGSSHSENMKKLCSCLENVMNVQSLYDFHKFLSNDTHLPIEVNFKSLKYQNLAQMFEDWLISKQENTSQVIERSITHKHRNILFKRILIEQQQTIKQYFQTLSQQKKLKGFDLFQLLNELLGPYFLYEFNSDNLNFFQKVNSFQNFTKVVQSFVKNGIRIYNKDRQDPSDQFYIRLHQLQGLIQFWQLTNPELTIQETPRKNMNDASVQTILVNSTSSQTQTDKESPKIYLNVINRTLHDINFLIEAENDPQILKSLDKMLDILRSQKIFVATYNSRKNQRKLKIPILSSGYSETQPLLLLNNSRVKVVSPPKNRTPNKILNNTILSNQSDEEDDCKTIFRYLCKLDKLNCLTLDMIHRFFCDLGLIEERDTYLIQKLMNFGYIEDRDDITLKQFKSIIRQVMKEDKRLGNSALKKYIAAYIQESTLRTTAYFKQAQPKGNGNLSTRDRDRSFRQQSRTTYPMDSDGSVI